MDWTGEVRETVEKLKADGKYDAAAFYDKVLTIERKETDPEAEDTSRCYSAYGPPLTHCHGGRIVVVGYICPHCGSSNPSTECKEPRT